LTSSYDDARIFKVITISKEAKLLPKLAIETWAMSLIKHVQEAASNIEDAKHDAKDLMQKIDKFFPMKPG
jgi:hypothetical protein